MTDRSTAPTLDPLPEVAQAPKLDWQANRELSNLEYHRGSTVLRNKPEFVAIEGTNHCNIKCIMCPRGEPDIMRREVGHMDLATLKEVVDKAEFFSDPTWLHWFGEPLMNPELFDAIAIAKRKIPNVGISTNATLLNERNQERLLDSGLDTILIAIDGDTKEVYENVRKSVRFSFEQVVANAEAFLARRKARGQTKPHVTLSIIAMEKTSPDLESFRRHWLDKGADEVIFKPFTNWATPDSFDKLAGSQDKEKLGSPRPHPCKFLWESFVVAWDGKVVPCCWDYDAKLVLGDLTKQTVEEIWNGPAYVELRKAELEGRNRAGPCENCSLGPGWERDPNWVPPSQAGGLLGRAMRKIRLVFSR